MPKSSPMFERLRICALLWRLSACASLIAVASAAVAPGMQRRGPADPAEVEAFFDGVMAAHRQTHHFAGATVSVVADGDVFFIKGYGFADVASGKPVDPVRTLFRIGSVSKLFT